MQELQRLIQEEVDKGANISIISVIDYLVHSASNMGASDIHIDPSAKTLRVRFRVDGVLEDVCELPKTIHNEIISRIKILSRLRTDEHNAAQDGRFRAVLVDTTDNIDIRVSIMPTHHGENAVLRLLSDHSQIFALENLGFGPKDIEKIVRAMKKTSGMILVTGPTGSGKTTTLYTIIKMLKSPENSIVTLEDPIEYAIEGIEQIQVNQRAELTFANGLRSILRQDPDIIMVGEIRDKETAEIAIHAALTGHLVLSTLHTNDAPTTLPRLSEMGIPAFLVASTVNVIVAQRLVRKICQDCIESYTLNKDEMEQLEKQVNLTSIIQTLEKEGIITKKQAKESLLFYRGKGCKKCGNEGYKGRLGIYEVMEVDHEISEMILKGTSGGEMQQKAKEKGMITILEDGFIKAKTGITTIEEILRVTKE